jgi:hypothetical protein
MESSFIVHLGNLSVGIGYTRCEVDALYAPYTLRTHKTRAKQLAQHRSDPLLWGKPGLSPRLMSPFARYTKAANPYAGGGLDHCSV